MGGWRVGGGRGVGERRYDEWRQGENCQIEEMHCNCVSKAELKLSLGRPVQRRPDGNGMQSALSSCVKVEVAVLGPQSLIVLTVSVDVKQHLRMKKKCRSNRAQQLCESRGGRPWLPFPDSPDGVCGRKVTLNLKH